MPRKNAITHDEALTRFRGAVQQAMRQLADDLHLEQAQLWANDPSWSVVDDPEDGQCVVVDLLVCDGKQSITTCLSLI